MSLVILLFFLFLFFKNAKVFVIPNPIRMKCGRIVVQYENSLGYVSAKNNWQNCVTSD